MLPPLATVTDLARRALGDPEGIVEGSEEHVRAVAALEDASSLARESSGSLTRWSDPATAPHPVVRVVLAAARRWWENPDATTSETIGGDSLSTSRLAQGTSVVLTEDERRTCATYGGGEGPSSFGGLGSLGLRRGAAEAPSRLVTVPVQVLGQANDGADALPLLDPEDSAAPEG